MKKLLLATTVMAALSGTVMAEDTIKVGILQGFTGPIESLTPFMADSAELALKEASDSGELLGGKKIEPVRADSTCVDAAAAQAAAERLVSSDKVVAIFGAACSGASTAVANNVAVPNGVVMISPSSTSPALSTIEDKGFFFRTAPSDARQGEVLAQIVKDRGIDSVAISYTNNDYGKGLSEAFGGAYEKLGGKIEINASHEDGKADYSAEVAALSASGAKELVVLGYLDQGGKGIIQTSLDTGAFERFIMADGMIGESIMEALGKDMEGSFGTLPGGENEGAEKWAEVAKAGKIENDGDGPYRGESYDAGALIALAMQAAGSADRAKIQEKMMEVANAPGEKILPGEIAKGLKLLADGKDIDYVGATNIEFIEVGEVPGSYKEVEVKSAKFETLKVH
uniref:Branched-chain amino acid ABC transporter, amino acid-binding protein (TC 3.A.1.4.1) n=1 Tax=uncultured Thiotrichaceae bacterium TaxID=298394 RepID=A0A6S6U6A6_9GAMM|nr:MAG: Branched-chain amino acid ABC transporter, amino acid-binding protein (TC 3.A.1.4.1) [uncultured Thiotrichaceae bacterium]